MFSGDFAIQAVMLTCSVCWLLQGHDPAERNDKDNGLFFLSMTWQCIPDDRGQAGVRLKLHFAATVAVFNCYGFSIFVILRGGIKK
jgi:hypothetical protein